jgi:mono/diheme cytochrome c family protein
VYGYGISEAKSPNMKKESFYDAVASRWGGPDTTKLASYNANDNAYDVIDHGQQVYLRYCVNCHGPNGDMGMSGAKVLATSGLNREGIHTLLNESHRAMPSYKKVLTENEKNAVASYVYATLGAGKTNKARANQVQ